MPERLTFVGSKEQSNTGTAFMEQIRTHSIYYHIYEADLHNQNQAERVIRELCRKWYHTIIRRRVPRDMWEYGIRWVSETTPLTHSSAGKL